MNGSVIFKLQYTIVRRFNLTLKIWSSVPVVDPVFFTGVRENRLCRDSVKWNDGVMECWPALARLSYDLLPLVII
jgi:hypothetical protein